jgi:hypothetical protein
MRAPLTAPVFRVFHQDDCVAEAALDTPPLDGTTAKLPETYRLTFELGPREQDTEYKIMVGDLTPTKAHGTNFRRQILWEEDLYLESARGLVELKLLSRPEGHPTEPWRLRVAIVVAVTSTKLTEETFDAMVGDLTALSSGLLFDLVSKAMAGTRRGQAPTSIRISPRSAQLELHFLDTLTRDLGVTLLEIARQPEMALKPRRVIATWTGSERLSPDGLSWFAARGINPREASASHEILGPRLQTEAATDSAEHGVICWFLGLVMDRAAECAKRAQAERVSIEAEKPYRSYSFHNEPSLFDLYDKPKIDRLIQAIHRADRIQCAMRAMLALPFLRAQRPTPPREATPVFRYVLHYHRFWRAMREYLRRSTLLLEYNLDERSKPTWRMYEQWVFLQIAAACDALGLRPSRQESLFQRLSAHLFTVDLRRGTQLAFTSADGRVMALRYEPWIFARGLAHRNGDAVFQGREGEAPWSPDVLIEVYDPPVRDKPARLSLVIVVDAKYSRCIREHHWEDTSKYQMIRDTERGSQVVRQVWVAAPAEFEDGSLVAFRDPSVIWTSLGPDRPVGAGEFLQGAVSLIPDPRTERGTVCPAAKELMAGLLAWLNFPETRRGNAVATLDAPLMLTA